MTLCELTLNGKIFRGELLSDSSKEIKLKDITSGKIETYILGDTYIITKQEIFEDDPGVGSLQKTFHDIKNLNTNFFTKEEIYDITQTYDVQAAIELLYVIKELNINKENPSIFMIKNGCIQYAKNETKNNLNLINNDVDLNSTQREFLVLKFNEILNNFIESLKSAKDIIEIDSKIPDIFKIGNLKYFHRLQSIILST